VVTVVTPPGNPPQSLLRVSQGVTTWILQVVTFGYVREVMRF
jgi:hypothetical protein